MPDYSHLRRISLTSRPGLLAARSSHQQLCQRHLHRGET